MRKLTDYSKGFTLIEFLVSISITVIIMTVAVPTFKTMLHNMYIRSTTESIQSGLQLARMEAVRRNTSTRFALDGISTTAWKVHINSDNTLIQSRPVGENSFSVTNITLSPVNAVRVTFNSLGRIIANTDASATLSQIILDVPTTILSTTESKELRIDISSGGQVRMCNPALPNINPQGC